MSEAAVNPSAGEAQRARGLRPASPGGQRLAKGLAAEALSHRAGLAAGAGALAGVPRWKCARQQLGEVDGRLWAAWAIPSH